MEFSVCLVMVSGEVEGIVYEGSSELDKAVPFRYHRSDLLTPDKPCRHFQRVSEGVLVQFKLLWHSKSTSWLIFRRVIFHKHTIFDSPGEPMRSRGVRRRPLAGSVL
jgi:hypothetical protein